MNEFFSFCKLQLLDIVHSLSYVNEENIDFNQAIHIVLGNESCDLDSFTSAAVHAWHQTKIENGKKLYVPVMNIPKHMFKLRTEIVYIMEKYSISQDHILFVDDVDFTQLTKLGRDQLQVTMVDHNELSRSQASLKPFVVEVIDHHPYPTQCTNLDIQKNIELVGSCSTLVAEKMLLDIPTDEVPDEVLMLLLSAILLDTCNFSEQVGKATAKDVQISHQLRSRFYDLDVTHFYISINEAKYSIEGLSTCDLLIKDPKYVENTTRSLLFSTLHESLEKFLKRPDVFLCVQNFCRSQNFCGWISLAPEVADLGGHYKPITIYSTDHKLREMIVGELLSSTLSVKLSTSCAANTDVVFLRMYDCRSSRKQVLPIVRQALKATDNENLNF